MCCRCCSPLIGQQPLIICERPESSLGIAMLCSEGNASTRIQLIHAVQCLAIHADLTPYGLR